jgi:hypothetical protein
MSEQVYSTEELNSVLRRLTSQQLQFVAVRLYTETDAEAAESMGLDPGVVYRWGNKALVNEAVTMTTALYVKPIAQDMLQRLVIPSIIRLGEIISDREAYNRDVLRAIAEVLDRADLSRKALLEGQVKHEIEFTSESLLAASEKVAALERELFGDDDDDGGSDA